MRTLHISVLDKKAIYANRDGDIVCGNNDYMIEFAFDAEWDGYDEKTARFIWNGQYQDVKFVGTACYVPIVTHTSELRVGVYAGELSTTTSATISCQKSVLCDSSSRGGTVIINGGGSGDGAGVPVPTADDNGKVLTAEDGKAKWKEPTGGEGLPIITEDDAGKVLTANEDGTAGWKDPQGGISVTEITSPEEITADSPDGLYIQEGGSSGGNGGGTTIHYYNSLDQVPADLPEGSFVAVPSEEKVFDLTAMGFPVVAEVGQEYSLHTDVTELINAFSSGNVNFVFDFLMEGNKVTVRTGSVSMNLSVGQNVAQAIQGSAIVTTADGFVVACITVFSVGAIVINTKSLA